jgi:hypothetical protein
VDFDDVFVEFSSYLCYYASDSSHDLSICGQLTPRLSIFDFVLELRIICCLQRTARARISASMRAGVTCCDRRTCCGALLLLVFTDVWPPTVHTNGARHMGAWPELRA